MMTTRAQWRTLKAKHGIPDGVCKFSMGERIEAWHKKLAAATTAKDHAARLTAIDGLLADFRTYEAALKSTKADKFKGKTPTEQAKSLNDTKAAVQVERQSCEQMQKGISALAKPLVTLKTNLARIRAKLNNIKKDDGGALQEFYSSEYRNELGKFVKLALAQNPTGKLKAALENYKEAGDLANDLLNADGKTSTADLAKVYAAFKMGIEGLVSEV
ncbi:MAG: hypothetical protein IT168_05555 [Bryobacterales bacterium]|nr:hypothetical protein [Bryobacterales bacterium]